MNIAKLSFEKSRLVWKPLLATLLPLQSTGLCEVAKRLG